MDNADKLATLGT